MNVNPRYNPFLGTYISVGMKYKTFFKITIKHYATFYICTAMEDNFSKCPHTPTLYIVCYNNYVPPQN